MSNRFGTRTAFSALPVDSGEESDEEISEQVDSEAAQSSAPEPSKPTKSALKKAARAARAEKRAQQKAAAKAQAQALTTDEPVSTPDATTPPASAPSVAAAEAAPTEVNGDSTPPAQPEPQIIAPKPQEVPVANGVNGHARPHDEPFIRLASVSGRSTPEPTAPSPNGPVADDVPIPKPAAQKPSVVNKPKELAAEPAAQPPSRLEASQPPTSTPAFDTKQAEQQKKQAAFITRTIWTFIMIAAFIGFLTFGHGYMVLLVHICQTLVYREVTNLFALSSKNAKIEAKKDPWSVTLNWYFFAVTNYFLYGESIIYYFKHVVFADANLLPFATNHRMLSFMLYTLGFVGFVMSLQKGQLKQQFGLFCWVHMSLLLVVVSSHFIVNNILEGVIWFWVPASLVICNDVFAYICGITFGKTPLIQLSPKKTVEGFVGAFFCTMAFGVAWGTFFMRFNYMICPVRDLGKHAWEEFMCKPNPVFMWREWQIWGPVASFLSNLLGHEIKTIPYAPFQGHVLVMAIFASLVAPFGGFFASGFKRAFNIKDFGHSIPGHGGMTDRMDCQFLMGVFTYVYYSSLIREHHVTVGSVLQTIVSGLTTEEQLELIKDLKGYLQGQGISVP